MRTDALAVKNMSAVAADIAGTVVAEIAGEGKDDVDQQQRIADVVEREDAEDDIVDADDCHESQHVEQGLSGCQHAENVVERCDSYDEDGPYGRHKNA